jgi:hypothetical protein
MTDYHPPEPTPAAWPPREGYRFFFFWLGGSIASWVATRVLWSAVAISQGPSVTLYDQRWLTALPSVALGVWHGWLLFSPNLKLRWIVWTALPLMYAVVPYIVRSPSPLAIATTLGLTSIVTTIISSLLLNGVRRRPWLWLFILLGGLVLNQTVGAGFVTVFGMSSIDRFAAACNRLLGLSSPIALSGSFVLSSAMAGIWLATSGLAAWALAWWMTPVRKSDSTDLLSPAAPSPLPPQ